MWFRNKRKWKQCVGFQGRGIRDARGVGAKLRWIEIIFTGDSIVRFRLGKRSPCRSFYIFGRSIATGNINDTVHVKWQAESIPVVFF